MVGCHSSIVISSLVRLEGTRPGIPVSRHKRIATKGRFQHRLGSSERFFASRQCFSNFVAEQNQRFAAPHVTGNVHTDWPIVSDSNLDYDAIPNGVSLKPAPGGRVGFSCNIPIHAVANYKFFLGGWQHNDITINGSVNGDLLPSIKPNWSVDPNLNAHVNISEAVLHIGNLIGDIDLTGIANNSINGNLPTVLSQITPKVNDSLNLRARVAAVWNDSAQSHQISKDPDVFLVVVPQSISFMQIKCNPDGTLTAAASLSATIHTYVGNITSNVTVPALPALTVVQNLVPKFSLYLPVTISLGEIERVANEQLSGTELPVSGVFRVSVKDVRVGALADKLLVRANVRATRTWFSNPLEADITLEGIPILSSDGTRLSFDQFNYTADTESRLLKGADWLLKPILLQELEKRLTVDVQQQLEKVRTDANQKLAQLIQNKSFQPDIKLEKLQAAKCVLNGDQVIALFNATGTSEMKISF